MNPTARVPIFYPNVSISELRRIGVKNPDTKKPKAACVSVLGLSNHTDLPWVPTSIHSPPLINRLDDDYDTVSTVLLRFGDTGFTWRNFSRNQFQNVFC